MKSYSHLHREGPGKTKQNKTREGHFESSSQQYKLSPLKSIRLKRINIVSVKLEMKTSNSLNYFHPNTIVTECGGGAWDVLHPLPPPPHPLRLPTPTGKANLGVDLSGALLIRSRASASALGQVTRLLFSLRVRILSIQYHFKHKSQKNPAPWRSEALPACASS